MGHLWIDAVLRPSETFKREKANATITRGIVNLGLAGFILGLLFGGLSFLVSILSGKLIEGVITIIAASIAIPIFLVITELITALIIFIIAKIVGGKGSFSSLFYLISLYTAPLIFLQVIPIVNILVGIYSIYLLFLAIKESQELSTGRTVLVLFLPLILIAIIIALAVMVFLIGPISSI